MANDQHEELPIPHTVYASKRAMEIARIWIAGGDQHIILTPNLWEDPGNWGIMLVDLAKHVAKAYAGKNADQAKVLSRIKAAFDAEWECSTDEPVQRRPQ